MIVWVTKEDIKMGKPGNPYSCPIAVSLNRRGKRFVKVERFNFQATRKNGDWAVFKLSERCRKFIDRFDSHLRVRPFHFKLED